MFFTVKVQLYLPQYKERTWYNSYGPNKYVDTIYTNKRYKIDTACTAQSWRHITWRGTRALSKALL